MEKKFLKIVQKGFENYNGPLSVYEFVNGVSIEAIPSYDRDRIAATMACVEVSENGKEFPAGIAERLVKDSANRAPMKEKFEIQSVDDKIAEERNAAEKVLEQTKTIYTEEELDKIIEEGGIADLRRVAEIWNVKNRSIPTLRQMILDEQDAYMVAHGLKVEANKAAVEKVVRDTQMANQTSVVEKEELSEEEEPSDEDVIIAATTGDLGAALTEDTDLTEKAE